MRAPFVRLVVIAAVLALASAASAQSVADFYRGKRVTLIARIGRSGRGLTLMRERLRAT